MVTANQKPTIHTHTHTKERTKSLLVEKVIKPQGKKQKKEKMNREKLPKQPENQ